MTSLRWRLGVGCAVLFAAAAGWAADPPGQATPDPKFAPPQAAPPRSDFFRKLPPGTVIVVTDNPKDALNSDPKLILLTPQEYARLRDEIADLRARLGPDKPLTPTSCKLTGAVEGDVVRLRAEFEFQTPRDNASVLLGFGSGQPTGAALDGGLPVLQHTDKGFVVLVEKAGKHQLRLEVEVKVGARAEHGFELDLPRAPVTSLELDLPEGVKEARLSNPGGAAPARLAARPEGKHSRVSAPALGPRERLEVTWKGPAAPAPGAPLLTAQGLITVRLFEEQVLTEAELTLKPLRGPAAEWRLLVPPSASVQVRSAADEERQAVVEPADPKQPGLRVIRLPEPSADPLQVVVQVEQRRLPEPLAVGPFVVVGAGQQRGTIAIAAPAEPRLRYRVRGAVSRREVSADDRRRDPRSVAAFTYWSVPEGKADQGPPPFLEIETEAGGGTVDTRVVHAVQLGEQRWSLTTTLEVTPLAPGIDQLRVQLPGEGFRLNPAAPPRPGEPAFSLKESDGVSTVVLAQKQAGPFRVTLEGWYPPPAEADRQASLELPQPQKTGDRGGQVTVTLPPELELVPARGRDPGWVEVSKPLRHNSQTWTTDRMPERLEVAWQPHRPELVVRGVADVTLEGGQAQVRHAIWFPGGSPAQVRFKKPADLPVPSVERGKVGPADAGDPTSFGVLLPDPVSEERPLVLAYAFRAAGDGEFPLPLVAPEPPARGDLKVRVWAAPGAVPVVEGGPWDELPVEGAPGRARLASLVLRGGRPDLSLVLRLREAAATPLTAAVVERVLVRAVIAEGGRQSYHASFLVSQLSTPDLDLELPADPALVNLKVFVGRQEAAWAPLKEGMPRPAGSADPGRVARVRLGPGYFRRPRVVDVVYELEPHEQPGRGGLARALAPVRSILVPPRVCGDAGRAPVRWQVGLPADWVVVYQDGTYPPEQRWDWRGWLLAPQPAAAGADLQRWLVGGAAPEDAGRPPAADLAPDYPSAVSWRTDLEPLALAHVPQQAWLLSCSLVLMAGGLFVYFLRLPRGLLAGLLGLGMAAAAAVGLFWPGVLSVVLYGCEPGLAVLLAFLVVQWLLHRRYRRQVVFMPGFTRLKPGSSLIRGSSNRPRGEPSTVDALPPAGGPPLPGASAKPEGSAHGR